MKIKQQLKLGLCFSLCLANTILWANPEFITHPITLPKIINKNNLNIIQQQLATKFPEYIMPNAANLKLVVTKHSLLGTHYHFQQIHLGLPVKNSQIVVSIDKNNKIIQSIYQNLKPLASLNQTIKTQPRLSAQQAQQLAWDHLKASGSLLSKPKTILLFAIVENNPTLVYQVNLSNTQPLGDWSILIDPQTGAIIKKHNRILPRKPFTEPLPLQNTLTPRTLQQEIIKISHRLKNKNKLLKQAQQQPYVPGKAQVFDPNPKSTLATDDINDNSPASAFTPAYYNYNLQEISLLNNQYQLIGPWVHIEDFDDPTDPPSTTTNGQWLATRGDNAFNDAHTFYHIDHSQRYLQSLGFVGDKGIQMLSVGADTDGAYGWDNSYFMPEENRLSFGHGGITDSEDAEVVLHEYGHAIQFGIDPEWDDDWDYGDNGAMGEGFGDYWAATYRHETINGESFHPNWVFVWDGHNEYWPGRVLNAVSLQYDDSKSYDAHEPLGNYSTDELWSTPLYQAYITLRSQGISKADIDKIILEAHFGLGSGIKMRVMAQAIVNTAKNLFPAGAHAKIFSEKFKSMNILS